MRDAIEASAGRVVSNLGRWYNDSLSLRSSSNLTLLSSSVFMEGFSPHRAHFFRGGIPTVRNTGEENASYTRSLFTSTSPPTSTLMASVAWRVPKVPTTGPSTPPSAHDWQELEDLGKRQR